MVSMMLLINPLIPDEKQLEFNLFLIYKNKSKKIKNK